MPHASRQTFFPAHKALLPWIFCGQRAAILLATFVILSDLTFISLHTEAKLRDSDNSLLFIDFDRGYAEFFQYLKICYVLLLITLLAFESRSWRLFAWTLPFLYLLGDDALQFHERGGEYLAQRFSLQARWELRAADFGELAVSAFAGLLSLAILGIAYWRASKDERWVFQKMTALIAILAFFGVIIDLAHIALQPMLGDFDWIALLEDGGEMIATTLIVAFVLRLNLSGGEKNFAATQARLSI